MYTTPLDTYTAAGIFFCFVAVALAGAFAKIVIEINKDNWP
jgi:hypothetical protein